MTEQEMLNLLERCLLDAEAKGLDTWWARMYYDDAGEWLMALIELEQLDDAKYVLDCSERFKEIRKFMGDPKDP